MEIASPAFEQHQTIPKKYTGEGEDISPPLIFIDVPEEAKTIALIIDDPDAPMGTFDHWIVWNIPATQKELEEGADVPREGLNHFNRTRYGGPMPPRGPRHRYFFKAYALDTTLDLPEGATKEQLEEAIDGHVLEQAELIGIYQR